MMLLESPFSINALCPGRSIGCNMVCLSCTLCAFPLLPEPGRHIDTVKVKPFTASITLNIRLVVIRHPAKSVDPDGGGVDGFAPFLWLGEMKSFPFFPDS